MADSQYIIEIATSMPDGASTIAELDDLTAKLTGAGKRSDDFQRAVKRLTTDLDAAKVASAGAAAALAAGNDQYKILERDAIRAGRAVETANSKGRVSPGLVQQALDARARLDAYAGSLKKLEDASVAATGKQDKLAKVLANVNKIGAHADARAAALNMKYEKLGAAVSRLPGPLGRIGGELVGSAKAAHGASFAFGGVNIGMIALVAGSVIAVAAVAALTAVMIAGAIAATAYAVSQADAARTAGLAREAFAALAPETAAATESFTGIAQATGLADAELVALTKQLRAAKVSAADMPDALMAAALAERALGKGGASEFIDGIKDGTRTVKDFAREAEDKFGGVVADQLRGLDAQGKRFSKAWGKLFDGVELDPFLDAMSVIVGMFEKGHPLAEAFGLGVEGAINPIGPMALKAAYAVEAFALGFAIQLTKMYIAIKPALKWLSELFGMGEQGDGLLNVLSKIGEVAAVVAVVFGVALAAAMAVVSGAILAVVGIFAMFGAAIYTTITTVWALLNGLVAVGTAITEWATTVGVNIMLGLVQGITATVGAVVSAVSNAVGSAITAAKSVLGIASPSRVFAEIGDNTVMGFTESVDAGATDAQGSMASLVAPDAVAASAPAAGAQAGAGKGAGGGGKAFDFAGATFNFHGVKDAESARDMFAEMFTKLLEGDADSLAGAEVPA